MTTFFIKFTAASLLFTGLAGCVRHRSVEQKMDFDGDRWTKSTFLNGKEWIGTVTIVNNGSNQAFGMVGSQSDAKIGHFNITKDKLQFLSSDNFVNSKSKENALVNEWAISHSEYHQKVSGGRVSNIETENEDISWKDKKFFKVDFSSASISESASFPWEIEHSCWSTKSSQVESDKTEIGEDHINFTVAVTYERNMSNGWCLTNQAFAQGLTTNTVKYKYSYMTDFKSDYVPYVYSGESDPLMKKYGYFQTTTYTTDELRRTKATFLMNRWNPSKNHTFYFAEGFPEEYKWIYADPTRGVIAQTNKLFADNGIAMRFEVKDSDEQHQFGDIRYSFFNFVDDSDDNSPLGYGPSVAHPRTGEIISANSTIWTSSLKWYVKRLRYQADRSQGFVQKSSLMTKMDELLGTTPDQWTTASSAFVDDKGASDAFRFTIPDFTYGRQGSLHSADSKGPDLLTSSQNLPFISGATAATKAFTELGKIESSTLETDKRLNSVSAVQSFKRNQVRFLDGDSVAGISAALPNMSDEEIINDILYRVAIHEFGHNMNLRHNFYGSVDAALERGKKTTKHGLPIGSNSVMDYLDLKDELDQDQDWEAYDKSALLYAYSAGKIDDVKKTGRIHLFCTDEHLASNPLCNHFDSGATPTEVLKSLITKYDDDFYRRNFRDERAFWEASGYSYGAQRTMYSMKKFLNLYNYAYKPADLERLLGGLESLSPESKAAYINGMQADMKQAVKMSMAFYASVIAQSSADRPFTEVYDSWNGSLKYKGIFSDKVYASRFLLSQDGVSFNPNEGPYLMSFAQLLDSSDADLKKFARGIMEDVYTNTGDGYVGFSTMVRVNAILGTQFQKGSATAYQAGRVSCYKADSLKSRFGVDAAAFKDNSLVVLDDMTQVSDPYFTTQKKVSLRQIDGRYYAAGEDSNFLAYALLSKSSMSATDEADVKELNTFYYSYTEGKAPECQ